MSEDIDALRAEWNCYHGIPMCQDCKWKLGSMLTNNCACNGPRTVEQEALHEIGYKRARQLQALFGGSP